MQDLETRVRKLELHCRVLFAISALLIVVAPIAFAMLAPPTPKAIASSPWRYSREDGMDFRLNVQSGEAEVSEGDGWRPKADWDREQRQIALAEAKARAKALRAKADQIKASDAKLKYGAYADLVPKP